MGLLFESIYSNVLSIIAAILCVVVAYGKLSFTYWSRRKVPYITPQFFFGNTKDEFLLRRSFGECVHSFYKDLKSKGVRFGGFYLFSDPHLLILDPELVKTILTKDFSYFTSRSVSYKDEKIPFTQNLFILAGNKWRIMRQKLTPTFTSGKIKMMFQTMLACADGLENLVDDYIKTKDDIDIKDVCGRFSTDIIGSCAFGLDCKSIQNKDSEFYKYGRKFIYPTTINNLKRSLVRLSPKLFNFLSLRAHDEDISNFFMKVVVDTIDYRVKNNIKRNDFLQLLINIKNTGDVDANANDLEKRDNGQMNEQGLTMAELVAQCFIFFIAGYETTSTAMSLFLHDMSYNQDIQDRVRNEIKDMLKKYDGKITYEGIMELQYLEQALFESIRIHSSVPYISRVCNKDYKIPDSDVIIENGTKIIISTKGLQSDPEYYAEPNKYDPERFNKEEQTKRRPFTFLPFGEGPRICIAQRFALMEAKIGLVVLLKNHRFSISKKSQIPLKINPKSNFLSVIDEIWTKAERI